MGFDDPVLLVLALVSPALLGVALLLRRRASRFAVAYPNLPVLRSVIATRAPWRRLVPLAAVVVALTAVAVALARPHMTLQTASERATVVLVLDTSRSMQSPDVQPTRLEAAKRAALAFVDRVPERLRLGLITFSEDVTVAATPTRDHDRVRRAIGAIDRFTGFGGGTAIGDAIARAVEVGVQATGDDAAASGTDVGKLVSILFLSDGRQNRGILPPMEGAARAKELGIAVHTVALGTAGGGAVQGGGGGAGYVFWPNRAPDPATLRAIAQATGGDFALARTAPQLRTAYESLGSRLGRAPERVEVTVAFVAIAALALLAGALSGAWWAPRLP